MRCPKLAAGGLLLGLWAMGTGPAQAAESAWVAQWRSFQAKAIQSAPELEALRMDAEAKALVAQRAGLAPRPMVEAGMMNLWEAQGPQLAVAQDLPLGPRWSAEAQLARSEAALARAAWRQGQQALIWKLGQAYWAWLGAHAQLRLAQEGLGWAQTATRLAQARLAQGQGSALALVALQGEEEESALALEAAQAEAEVEAQALATEMGEARWPRALRPQALPPVPTAFPGARPTAELWARWWEQHPEAQALGRRKAIAQAKLAVALAASSPEWKLKLNVGQWPMGMAWQTMWGGMVGASWPAPWENNSLEALALAARKGIAQAEAESRQAQLRWRGEGERTWTAWRLAHAQNRRIEGPQWALAERAWRLTLARQAAGQGNADEAIQAQRRWVALKRQAAQTRQAYRLAEHTWTHWIQQDLGASEGLR